MTLTGECGNCARPCEGAAICATCTTGLRDQLRSVPGLVDDLLVAMSRQDRITGGSGGRASEAPLPVRLDIGHEIDRLGNALTTWARDLCEIHRISIYMPGVVWALRADHNIAITRQTESLLVAACWLAGHVHLIRIHTAALEALRDIEQGIGRARARTDRREPLAYRGQCWECGAELRAAPQAAIVTCPDPDCREQHDGPKLRAWLLKQAREELLTAAELSAALTGLAERPVPAGTIKSWRARGQLVPRAWLHGAVSLERPHLRPVGPGVVLVTEARCCRPLYRVGDAQTLLADGDDPA